MRALSHPHTTTHPWWLIFLHINWGMWWGMEWFSLTKKKIYLPKYANHIRLMHPFIAHHSLVYIRNLPLYCYLQLRDKNEADFLIKMFHLYFAGRGLGGLCNYKFRTKDKYINKNLEFAVYINFPVMLLLVC